MICWDRVGDHLVVGVFEQGEVGGLRRYLTGLRNLLDERFAGYSAWELGMPFPVSEAVDPRLRAILRRRSVGVSRWQEPEVLRPLREAVEAVLVTLPDRGGIVELRSVDVVVAWTRSLTDLRVAMSAAVRDGDPVVASRTRFTTRWLRSLVRTLDAASTKPAEVVPQNLVDSVNQVRAYWI
ncbi:hypothetical protein [Umezawaea sp. Da 62-37]|uniref:DUF2017 family protein n=1 Tax=Umezawaea sp. Da 62-37 TaxID=3075927 RepID=UPI0028F6EDCD|nr:hypothetical protein [Umezawaea sp. Da 62-37]WNV82672.1 hypothetical protein RM788_31300 [Umezawaea sp. Da 62-37]